MIRIVRSCKKELEELPEEVREELADALARLELGQLLSMPLSRPYPNIASSVHELRLGHRSGAYRIFYFLSKDKGIVLIHAFKKKSNQTPFRVIELVRNRLKKVEL